MSSSPYWRVSAQFENGNLAVVLALLPYSTLDLKSVSLYSAQMYADSISKSWNSIKVLERRLIAVCYWNVSDNDENWVLKSQPIWVTQYVCLFP